MNDLEKLKSQLEEKNTMIEEMQSHLVETIIDYQDQIDNLRQAHAQLMNMKLKEKELQIAADIQNRLLPPDPTDVKGLQIAGLMQAAKEVGGDYYDFFRSEAIEGFNICIGDVSGKGLPAGLIMVMARSFLRSLRSLISSLKDTASSLNSLIINDMTETQFMTMLFLHWSEKDQRLSYVGAGHEHILVYKAISKNHLCIKTGGILVGMLPDISPIVKEKEIELEPGDMVLLYTDGVTEARNEKNELFTLPRLEDLLDKYGDMEPKPFLQRLLGELKSFMGTQTQFDDITMVALKKI